MRGTTACSLHSRSQRKYGYNPSEKSSEKREGSVMTRWLWVLLAAVVLIGLGVFFWSTSNQTNTSPVAQAPVPAPPPAAQAPAPRGPARRSGAGPRAPARRSGASIRAPARRSGASSCAPARRTGAQHLHPSPPLEASICAPARRSGASICAPARNRRGEASCRFGIPRQ